MLPLFQHQHVVVAGTDEKVPRLGLAALLLAEPRKQLIVSSVDTGMRKLSTINPSGCSRTSLPSGSRYVSCAGAVETLPSSRPLPS